jgi:GTP-binding protein
MEEIPGLIEGAHRGRGLGHEFLRHAERTKILLHLIDGTAEDPTDNMNKLNRELALYKPEMAQKSQIVAVNKVDLFEVRARMTEITGLFKSLGIKVFFVSAVSGQGLPELLVEITGMLDTIREMPLGPEIPIVVFRPQPKVGRKGKDGNK